MAKAKREGGLYYRGDGTAVDAEGKVVEDAPKRPADTPPEKQPGAVSALLSTEERIAVAVASAIGGKSPKGQGAVSGQAEKTAGTGEKPDAEELPTVADLPAAVAKLKTAAEVKAMAKRDDRVSAEPIYKARLAELKEEK